MRKSRARTTSWQLHELKLEYRIFILKIKENNDKTTILHIRNYHKTGGKKRPTTTEQCHDRTIDGSDMAAWQHGIATYDTTPTTALRGWRGVRGGRSRGCMRF